MEMSDKIRVLRKELNLTLEQVGNEVGVGKSTVRKWENGDIANMRRDKIAKLASALHTTPGYLMGWEPEPEKASAADCIEKAANHLGYVFTRDGKDAEVEYLIEWGRAGQPTYTVSPAVRAGILEDVLSYLEFKIQEAIRTKTIDDNPD